MIATFLAILTLAGFYRALSNGFVYDDRPYVLENKHVIDGLTSRSVVWAFTGTHAANWHPVTWLSHMLDCQLFGLNTAGHHATNLVLHAINSILLFLLLASLTKETWKSAFVATLFAIHPLRVESVAWVAERKDVLSTFFWFLTTWSYCAYVDSKAHGSRMSAVLYAATLVLFAIGLMAKPMLVTLPFALVLLDYWPLGRLSRTGMEDGHKRQTHRVGFGRYVPIVIEKIPLLLFAAASSFVTYRVQQASGAMGGKEEIMPLGIRLANAVTSYVMYIYKMVWPAKLAVLYPHPVRSLPIWQPMAAIIILTLVTFLVVRSTKRHPYLTFGWFWYLGTLVPVIGIVQVGAQAMADRYTYVPLIGLFVILAWGLPDVLNKGQVANARRARLTCQKFDFRHMVARHSTVLVFAVSVAVLALGTCTWTQTGYWKDSLTLFGHALRVTRRNYVAHNNYGAALEDAGQFDEAAKHYQAALTFRPRYLDALNNMGNAFRRQKKYAEAEKMYRRALEIEPRNAKARGSLAATLEALGRIDEAIAEYRKALKLHPKSAALHNDLGKALSTKGLKLDALREWREAIRLDPKCVEAHYNMALYFTSQGNTWAAIKHYESILATKPDHMNAHLNLGALFSDLGKHEQAIQHYNEVIRIDPAYAPAHHNLAVSYFLSGNYAKAWQHVALARKYGLTPDPRLIRDLSAKMPEPQN